MTQSPNPQAPACAFHPDRVAYVQCQRCGRHICPECQTPAAVGVQCPACVREGRLSTPAARSVFGAPLAKGYPVVTITAIAACVVMHVVQLIFGVEVQIQLGFAPIMAWVQPYRFLTAAFLHGGVAHLLLNMYALWVVGSFVEQLVGRWRFAGLYLVSAIGGNMAVMVWARIMFPDGGWTSLTVGASGAVFGLFAATLVLSRRLGRDIRGIATVIGLNLVLSFVMYRSISWQGHIGGLITGAGLAAIYAHAPKASRNAWGWAGIVGFLALYVVGWYALTH